MRRYAKIGTTVALIALGVIAGLAIRPVASRAQPAPQTQCMISAATDNVAWTLCGTGVHRCVYDGHQINCV